LPTEPSNQYLMLPPAVRLAGNWTSVVSRWSYGFHHWWMDVLPRLAVLHELPADTQILVHPKLDLYQVETLKLLGLQDRVRLTPERHLLVENYFFASPTGMTGCRNPYAVEWLRQHFLSFADKEWQSPRRFYIRRLGRTRGLVNEAEVIDFLQQKGWAIVDLESMPVRRQIQLFAGAELVCGLHGAAFTNLLWSSSRCRVLEICAANFLNGVYEGLAEVVGARHRFIICSADGAFVARVPMKDFQREIIALEADL
jgi:capsular polysaccharide biosynthesis protein